MSSCLLLIVLLIGVMNCQQLPSVSAESNYCNVSSLATPELVLNIGQNFTDQSSYQIKLTQHYEVNTTTITLGYIQAQKDLILQSTTSNLISTLYTESVSNELVFIDAKNGYILAIQITDKENHFFDYILLKANIDSPNSNNNTMIKYTLIPDTADNSTQSIADSLIILKIISMDSSSMYFLTKEGSAQQSLYKLSLNDLQPMDSQKQLIFVANINESDKPVNIIGGNIYHLYDRNSMIFYELQTNTQTQQQYYKSIMLSQLNIDSIMNLDTLNFVSLSNHLVIMYSYLNGQTIMIPITENSIQSSQAVMMAGSSNLYTDNWRNCLLATDHDFLWVRSQPNSSQWNYQQFSTTLPIEQRDQLQAIMSNAQYISFDGSYAMVVSKNVGNQQGSLTSVFYDTVNAPYFTIVDSLKNSINLSQLQFSNSNGTSSYITSFKCNCVNLEVERLECYSGPLKCITVTKSIRTDCTKTS